MTALGSRRLGLIVAGFALAAAIALSSPDRGVAGQSCSEMLAASPESSARARRDHGRACANSVYVSTPGTGGVIGGFGLSEPEQRAALAYVAASVEIPRQPILDRDGNAVNRAFFCDPPFIDLSDTRVAVTIWCHGPRDLPKEVVGLLTLDSVIDVPGDNGSKTVVVGHCEERLPIPSHRVFWCDVPRPIGPLSVAGTPVPVQTATP